MFESRQVIAEVIRCLPRHVAGALTHFRPLLHLAHRLTDDRAAESQVLNERRTPFSELALRIDWSLRQRGQVRRLRQMLHRFADQRFLGTELPENRDFIDAGGISNAACRGTAEPVLGEHPGSRVEYFVSSIHGRGFYTKGETNASSHLLTQAFSLV